MFYGFPVSFTTNGKLFWLGSYSQSPFFCFLHDSRPSTFSFPHADEPKLLNITTTKEKAPTRHRIHYLCGHSAVPSTWWIHVVVYAHVGATYMRSNIHTTYSTIFDEGLPDVCKRGQIRHSDMATCTESKINQGNKRKRKKLIIICSFGESRERLQGDLVQ